MSIETQTEAFMDRPPSPLFVPAKSGVDADTQVVVGELFEFDLEVRTWIPEARMRTIFGGNSRAVTATVCSRRFALQEVSIRYFENRD